MPAEFPNVTKLGHRWPFRTKTHQVIGRISCRGLLRTVYQQVDFPGRKTGELDIEIEFDQILEMASQQIKIPHRLLGQPIVSDDHGPLVTVGTSVMARRLAASNRPCPARMVPVSSTRIGLVQNRRMLFIKATIWLSG